MRYTLVALTLGVGALVVAALPGCFTQAYHTPNPPDGDGDGGTVAPVFDVRSTPSGARIVIDGDDTGSETPASVRGLSASAAGTPHVVRLELSGYYPFGTVVMLYTRSASSVQELHADLVPVSAPTASVYVQTSPPGAEVLIDSEATGLVTPTTIDGVGQSRHTLEVRLSGYSSRTETVDMTGRDHEDVELVLNRTGRTGLSGIVYDKTAGGLIVGATVAIEGTAYETTTTVEGSYVFENLPTDYYDLVATKTLQAGTVLVGRRENAYVDPTNGRMMSADILMATQDEMAQASGRVLDVEGRGIANAYVYLDMNNAVYFTPVDEGNGAFSFTQIPATPRPPEGEQRQVYRLVASAPGYSNGATEVTLEAGDDLRRDLTLDTYGSSIPADPLFDSVQALTYPTGDTAVLDATLSIRQLIIDRSGRHGDPRSKIVRALAEDNQAGVRAYPPAGHLIEMDLYWEANDEPDLAGYHVRRSLSQNYGYDVVATLWDPNATFIADISPDLGPAQDFYYDLVAFNLNGDEGSPSEWLKATPLGAVDLEQPTPGSSPTYPVTFSWNAVPEAGVYEIWVFDVRPDYDTGNQTGLVWDNGAITPERTSISFGDGGQVTGQGLVTGQDYYAIVAAGDGLTINDSNSLTFSSAVRFVAP